MLPFLDMAMAGRERQAANLSGCTGPKYLLRRTTFRSIIVC